MGAIVPLPRCKCNVKWAVIELFAALFLEVIGSLYEFFISVNFRAVERGCKTSF